MTEPTSGRDDAAIHPSHRKSLTWHTMRTHPRRSGFSLLEVVLALAILAAAFAVLGQLTSVGVRAAIEAHDIASAETVADTIMSEILAGILPPDPVIQSPVTTDPQWVYSVALEPTPHLGTLNLVVLVEHVSPTRRRSRFQLARWIRDPSLEIPADEPNTDASEESSDNASTSESDAATGGAAGPTPAGGRGGGRGGGGQGGGGQGGRGQGGDAPPPPNADQDPRPAPPGTGGRT